MSVTAAASSTKGLLKKINQDNILLKKHQIGAKEILLAVVCDGVGGLDNGEVASSYVVDLFSKWFDGMTTTSFSDLENNFEGQLKEFVEETHNKLKNIGYQKGKNLGTTLTALLLIDNEYYIVHVGDTRIYLIERCSIVQLTKDHTEYERCIEYFNDEAAQLRSKNVLWQCVGGSRIIEPQILKGAVDKGTFLLCSDGFRDEVSEKELLDKIACDKVRTPTRLKEILEDLINLNLERNEKDNISAILIDIDSH